MSGDLLGGDLETEEFIVLRAMFEAGFDWARPKPSSFRMREIKELCEPKVMVEAAVQSLAAKKLLSRDQSSGRYDLAYRLTRKGITWLAMSHLEGETGGDLEQIDSSLWTGLPKEGILSEAATIALKRALTTVDHAIEIASSSNEEKAQARAFAIAIHALADAPQPPADLVWKIFERANSIAGIASFFVAIAALFASVSH